MSFRKLLVPLAGVDSDSAAIDTALVLGREFEAKIVALHARPPLRTRTVASYVNCFGAAANLTGLES